MNLDFITFINQNINLTAQKKQLLLADFCYQYGYQDQITDENGNLVNNPITKQDFANDIINGFLKDSVNSRRKKVAQASITYEELEY